MMVETAVQVKAGLVWGFSYIVPRTEVKAGLVWSFSYIVPRTKMFPQMKAAVATELLGSDPASVHSQVRLPKAC